MRRGVVVTVTLPPNAASFSHSVFCAASCIHAGISSTSSSKKYSAIRRNLEQWEAEGFARFEILMRAGHGEIAHALDHADAFGHRHRAARIERVEDVRALEREVIRGKNELLRETSLRFRFVGVEQLPMQIDVGDLEVVLREFEFFLLAHGTVAKTAAPFDVIDGCLARDEHRQPFQSVRDLRADRREIDAAGLLKIRELRDLHAVEEDLPADAPCAEGRRLPVVFLEADVVAREIESDGAQRIEIEIL